MTPPYNLGLPALRLDVAAAIPTEESIITTTEDATVPSQGRHPHSNLGISRVGLPMLLPFTFAPQGATVTGGERYAIRRFHFMPFGFIHTHNAHHPDSNQRFGDWYVMAGPEMRVNFANRGSDRDAHPTQYSYGVNIGAGVPLAGGEVFVGASPDGDVVLGGAANLAFSVVSVHGEVRIDRNGPNSYSGFLLLNMLGPWAKPGG